MVSDLRIEKQHKCALKTNPSVATSLTEVMTSQKSPFAFQHFDCFISFFGHISGHYEPIFVKFAV